MTVTEALNKLMADELKELIDRMTYYTLRKLRSAQLKDFEGLEPVDFVYSIFQKALDGTRQWDSERCSLKWFLFWALRSEINAFFKKKRPAIADDDFPDIPSIDQTDTAEEKKLVLDKLEEAGADAEEILVMEVKMDGTVDAAGIAEILGIEVLQVYNINKRLKRRLDQVGAELKGIV